VHAYVTLRGGSLAELRERIPRLEDLGLTGVLVGDHLFVQAPGQTRAAARRPLEPMTALAAVATLSERLHVGTMVSNLSFLHPALVLRQFAGLAALFGGERVLAGLGAGWNRHEFAALGLDMPSFNTRLDRLEESANLARQLFDHGIATVEGSCVVARELPIAPVPKVGPRILLGGGSDRLLDIAGRYADVLDLNGSSRREKVAGADLGAADARRRMTTTSADLELSVERVQCAAKVAGRPRDAVTMSVLVGWLEFCTASEVATISERLCRANGLAPQSLDECPYALLGEPAQMIDKLQERCARFGLDMVIIAGSIDPERFCQDVLPYVS
jgi:alkanesulfonate monooxygenase SsuD/methylene tetrahydromethanopterin reductase-like flavin-dependent oxidoreductase (luciferase family)